MKQVKPMNGMPGINSAFALPHIDKALAIDDSILPNAGYGKTKHATLRTATTNNTYKGKQPLHLSLKIKSNCDSAQRPEPQLWCQQCFLSSRNDQAKLRWMGDSDRDNLFFRIGLIGLRLEVSESKVVIIETPQHKHLQKCC